MKPRPRIRKTVKWGGLAAALFFSGAFAASLGFFARWSRKGDMVQLSPGVVLYWHATHPDVEYRARMNGACPTPLEAPKFWAPHARRTLAGYELCLPLWIPAAACALASAVAWRLDARARRRARAGLCPACGYDRAGLAPAAACPECGAAPAANAASA